MSITYSGLAAFGEDRGTLWIGADSSPLPLIELQKTSRSWRRALKRRLQRRPIVWFADDERANREWFKENHRSHFALLTFSSRAHLSAALAADTPCDVVVTDIFFPAKPPVSDVEANQLLGIYDEINRSSVTALRSVWNSHRDRWSLDGFDIARDVAEHAARHREQIPVLLFSRKATLLLNSEDWLAAPSSAVENTHWMLEKLDPLQSGEAGRRAASIQRDRIVAALKYRQASARWWLKALNSLSIGLGPLRFSVRDLLH